MKILHMHTSLKSGGIEAMVCHLANEMVKRHDVTFCSIFELTDEDVFLNRLDSRVCLYSLNKKTSGVKLSMLYKIYKFIKKGHYDIIQLHGFFYYYIIAVFFLHHKCKFFYTVHNDAIKENVKWDKKLFLIKKFFFQKGWMTPITISHTSKKSFEDLYGITAPLIYNGTVRPSPNLFDISRYKISSRTRVLLNPGRICMQKNQEMLCLTCSKLIKEGFDIVLLIAGVNQDSEIFSKISAYFNERIIYIGERNDIIDIMASADALCLSSSWEGMPVVLLEALSVGCVPVCTPVGGIPDVIVNGETGFVSESTSKEDYYDTLKSYLSSENETLKQIALKDIDLFKSFDIANTALFYENLYGKVLGNE